MTRKSLVAGTLVLLIAVVSGVWLEHGLLETKGLAYALTPLFIPLGFVARAYWACWVAFVPALTALVLGIDPPTPGETPAYLLMIFVGISGYLPATLLSVVTARRL